MNAATFFETLCDRIAERLAARIVYEADDFRDRPPQRLTTLPPGQILRRRIHVIDAAAHVRRNDAVADRFERDLSTFLFPEQSMFQALATTYIQRRCQDRRRPPVLDTAAARLVPATTPLVVEQLDLVAPRDRLFVQDAAGNFKEQVPEVRWKQVANRPPGECLRLLANEPRGCGVFTSAGALVLYHLFEPFS